MAGVDCRAGNDSDWISVDDHSAPLHALSGPCPAVGHQNGVSEVRGPLGGAWVGFGLAAILLAQPLVYLALGFAFLVTVVGRIVSFIADRTFNLHCVAATLFEALLAFFPIAYALQLIP